MPPRHFFHSLTLERVWRNRGDEEPLVMAGQFLGEVFLACAGFEKRKEVTPRHLVQTPPRFPCKRIHYGPAGATGAGGRRGRRTDALWDAALILPEISGIPAVAPHYSAASVGGRAKRARGLFRARWPSLLL